MTTNAENMISLYKKIENVVTSHLLGHNPLIEDFAEFAVYSADFEDAAKKIDTIYETPGMVGADGYTEAGERATNTVIQALCRTLLPFFIEKEGVKDPLLMTTTTGAVAPLSERVCDYFANMPRQEDLPLGVWWPTPFDDSKLAEVRKATDGSWEKAD